MADNQTMEELLQAPTEGYGEAIVILEINADHFEIKTNLLQLEPTEGYGEAIIIPEILAENFEIKMNLLQACPHHGFSELTQIDTLYNGLNEQDQDSLNAVAGGNLLSKTTREALKIIKNKSKVRYSRSKSNVSRVNTNSRDVNKQVITPVTAKAVEKTCVICEGAHAYYDCIATDSNKPIVYAKM
nr:reverse transcriptase domain-containing protein [Tanacetum cinerariifolium]